MNNDGKDDHCYFLMEAVSATGVNGVRRRLFIFDRQELILEFVLSIFLFSGRSDTSKMR